MAPMRCRPIPFLALTAACSVFLCSLLAAPVRAQSSEWGITFASGFAKPEGGVFGAQWKSGTPVLLAMAGQMSTHFELGGEFGYVKFKPSGDSIAVPGITPGNNDWEMWRLRLRARRFFASADSKFVPFAMAGLGIYPISAQSEDSTGTLKVTQTGNGVSIGGGVDFRAGESVQFGLEAQYHYIRTKQELLGYKAAPMIEVLFAIRWIPGAGGDSGTGG
jgi:hypothetical protein